LNFREQMSQWLRIELGRKAPGRQRQNHKSFAVFEIYSVILIEDAPEAYEKFDQDIEGYIKVLIRFVEDKVKSQSAKA